MADNQPIPDIELGNLVFGNSRGEVPVPRHAGYEDILFKLFDAIGCDFYGENLENDVFSMMRYWRGDCTCGVEEGAYHETTCNLITPNFHYKPTDFKLSWYKYPLRDSYANRKVGLVEFQTMIERCVESLT